MNKENRAGPTATRVLLKSSLLLGFAVLALAAAGCGDDPAGPDQEAEPITLAAALAETGRLEGAGNDVAWGYRLAVELLNERGGIAGRPVQLVIRDDGSDPETSASLYSEYVASDTITALLGPYSSVITEAVIPVAEAAGIPLVAPMASAPELWAEQQRQWSVQMLNPAPTYVQGSVELAAEGGAETVALIYEDTAFPRSLANGVREAAGEHGLDLVLDRVYAVGEADHETLAAAARDAGGDPLRHRGVRTGPDSPARGRRRGRVRAPDVQRQRPGRPPVRLGSGGAGPMRVRRGALGAGGAHLRFHRGQPDPGRKVRSGRGYEPRPPPGRRVRSGGGHGRGHRSGACRDREAPIRRRSATSYSPWRPRP